MHIKNKKDHEVQPALQQAVFVTFPKYLSAKEVASMIGKHPKWLERKRWEGGGPKFRYIGKTPMYEEKDVIEWLNSIPKIENTSQPH